jgi:hypothetical protein
VSVAARTPVALSAWQERRLRLLFEACWPEGGECDIGRLGSAVARFAFWEGLAVLPANANLRREGVFFLVVSPDGDVRPVRLGSKGRR